MNVTNDMNNYYKNNISLIHKIDYGRSITIVFANGNYPFLSTNGYQITDTFFDFTGELTLKEVCRILF